MQSVLSPLSLKDVDLLGTSRALKLLFKSLHNVINSLDPFFSDIVNRKLSRDLVHGYLCKHSK